VSTSPPPTAAAPAPAQPAVSPASLSAPADPLARLRELHQRAAARYAGMDGYVVQMRRREWLPTKDKPEPEDLVACKFRKQPKSVYFQWVGPNATGREVVYVEGRHEGKIHTKLAKTDLFVPFGPKRTSFPPDSPLVRSRSRHSITEAGIGTVIDRYGQLVDALERGDPRLGTARYLGPQARPEFARPLEGVEVTIPPGSEPLLSQGGRRYLYFDPDHGLPALVLLQDAAGREVEYYGYDQWRYPVPLTDADFDPERLWPAR
jgi:hypothetical protein